MGRRAGTVAVVAALLVHGAGLAVLWVDYTPLRPVLDCVQALPDGSAIARFGWSNSSDEPRVVPVGADNRFIPGSVDRGQPTTFIPGAVRPTEKTGLQVLVPAGGSATWELDGRRAVADAMSPKCEITNAQKDLPEPQIETIKPLEKPVEVKKEEVKKEEPKKEEPKEAPKADAKKSEPPAGQPKRPRRTPKPVQNKPPTKAELAPLVLENVNLTGTVNVQKGDSDVFGDPSVAADERNTQPDTAPEGDGEATSGSGTGGPQVSPPKPPKIVSPKIKKSVKGSYPEDAPRLGRVVKVRLSLVIDRDGKVKKASIVKGAGEPFDGAARRVALQLEFFPGTRDGSAIELPVPWTVEFYPED